LTNKGKQVGPGGGGLDIKLEKIPETKKKKKKKKVVNVEKKQTRKGEKKNLENGTRFMEPRRTAANSPATQERGTEVDQKKEHSYESNKTPGGND